MLRLPFVLRVFGLLTVCLALTSAQSTLPPSCSSNIYCKGPVLHAVQTARLFRDSKTFVDLRMLKSEDEILEDYQKLIDESPNPTREELVKFVEDNFAEGKELDQWTPTDYNESPAFLDKITDPTFKQFAKDLVALWPVLARKIKPEVTENPDRYSLVPLPNGFVIPGGRFKEIYYWDSYWIIEGLIISGMTETAKGMIENLMTMIKKFGHILNGSRVYYSERSQPPLLTSMVALYFEATNDVDWLREHISVLEEELAFWSEKRTVEVTKNGQKYTVLRYFAESLGPRPESYYEDLMAANLMEGDDRKQELYTDFKSAAESGWDFSGRWFVLSNGSNAGNLSDIHTKRIIPVDLNAIYASALETVGTYNSMFLNKAGAKKWWTLAQYWRDAIDAVFWNDEDGIWYDYDMELQQPRKYFFPPNIAPIWKKCVDQEKLVVYAPKILNYLKTSGGIDYPGGIPASLTRTGEQWDFPNAWPPLQSAVIQGLDHLNTAESKEMAKNLAQLWLRANHIGFEKNKEMFEKYDAETPGDYGGGGEYVVQTGFGWSNGVVLELLNKYGDAVTAQDS